MQSVQQIRVGSRVESLELVDAKARGTVTVVGLWAESITVEWDDGQKSSCQPCLVALVVPDAAEHRFLAARHRKLAELAETRSTKRAWHSKWRHTQEALKHESAAALLDQVAS